MLTGWNVVIFCAFEFVPCKMTQFFQKTFRPLCFESASEFGDTLPKQTQFSVARSSEDLQVVRNKTGGFEDFCEDCIVSCFSSNMTG